MATLDLIPANYATLAEENRRLRAALKSAKKFIPVYEPWMDHWKDGAGITFFRRGATFGDLRRVIAALASIAKETRK